MAAAQEREVEAVALAAMGAMHSIITEAEAVAPEVMADRLQLGEAPEAGEGLYLKAGPVPVVISAAEMLLGVMEMDSLASAPAEVGAVELNPLA